MRVSTLSTDLISVVLLLGCLTGVLALPNRHEPRLGQDLDSDNDEGKQPPNYELFGGPPPDRGEYIYPTLTYGGYGPPPPPPPTSTSETASSSPTESGTGSYSGITTSSGSLSASGSGSVSPTGSTGSSSVSESSTLTSASLSTSSGSSGSISSGTLSALSTSSPTSTASVTTGSEISSSGSLSTGYPQFCVNWNYRLIWCLKYCSFNYTDRLLKPIYLSYIIFEHYEFIYYFTWHYLWYIWYRSCNRSQFTKQWYGYRDTTRVNLIGHHFNSDRSLDLGFIWNVSQWLCYFIRLVGFCYSHRDSRFDYSSEHHFIYEHRHVDHVWNNSYFTFVFGQQLECLLPVWYGNGITHFKPDKWYRKCYWQLFEYPHWNGDGYSHHFIFSLLSLWQLDHVFDSRYRVFHNYFEYPDL
ncbi:hypothetical protein F4778DRAFT_779695 [Xylariomycetidae sp. FL2044]|nr:hypothetical protein F4778DRAFT_779695 [Xylariomycetidae sp. FL2044]